MPAVRVLTHDRDVVLDQEQSLLAALHQHRQSVGVLLPVQRHPVYAQHSVAGLQRALSAEEKRTSTTRSHTSFPAPETIKEFRLSVGSQVRRRINRIKPRL